MAAGEEKGGGVEDCLRASEGGATWGQGHRQEAALKTIRDLPLLPATVAKSASFAFKLLQSVLHGVCSTKAAGSSPSPRV